MFSEASVSLLSRGGLHLVGVCIQGVAGCLHLGEEGGGCVSRGIQVEIFRLPKTLAACGIYSTVLHTITFLSTM